jgi:hypothetical protein
VIIAEMLFQVILREVNITKAHFRICRTFGKDVICNLREAHPKVLWLATGRKRGDSLVEWQLMIMIAEYTQARPQQSSSNRSFIS